MRGKSGATLRALRRAVSLVVCLVTALVATASAFAATRPMRTAIVDPPAFGGVESGRRLREDGGERRDLRPADAQLGLGRPGHAASGPDRPERPRLRLGELRQPGRGRDRRRPRADRLHRVRPLLGGRHDVRTRRPSASSPGRPRAGTRANRAAEPRVRYWQAWNEPNRDYFLMPQYTNGKMSSPALYRAMVNKFAAAVRDVSPTNRVIAGGLAPLGRKGKPAPLTFMKKLLEAPVSFDIWSHHPYTSGGPLHLPPGSGDIALGNLGTMNALLRSKDEEDRQRVPGAVLGDRVLLGLEPARPAGARPAAAQALGGRGALPDVVERRRARDLVPPEGRPAHRHRRDLLPVGLLHGRRQPEAVARRLPLPHRRADAAGRHPRVGPHARQLEHEGDRRDQDRRDLEEALDPPVERTGDLQEDVQGALQEGLRPRQGRAPRRASPSRSSTRRTGS